MTKRTKRQQAILKRRIFLSFCSVVLIAAILALSFVGCSIFGGNNTNGGNNGTGGNNSTPKPEPIPDKFATVVSIGDIMCHSTQYIGAKTADGGYDFSHFFKELSPYFKSADLAVGNLELTFGGTESGAWRGFPTFNTPDQLANAISDSGIGILMTANNHTYDTGFFGMKRTLDVVRNLGIETNGSRKDETEAKYIVKDLNGIKVGMVSFTYETTSATQTNKYLNGLRLSAEAGPLVNSFCYGKIDQFYTEAQEIITAMKNDGAEYITFYMHWGNEYQRTQNTWQKTLAQKLSNMGVNMIIGGHPHVVQPIEYIYSEDGQTETVCVYSLGNAVSNQRRSLMQTNAPKGHTEDGLMVKYTLKKTADGTVTLVDFEAIPTWVDRYLVGGKHKYTIYPMENLEQAKAKYPNIASKLNESYLRTKEIMGKGLTEAQEKIGCEVTFPSPSE
ncbi:MAG: CapA family protein [Clostridia bacterium]|nr:CapA family protein [Clostridia bacterium]